MFKKRLLFLIVLLILLVIVFNLIGGKKNYRKDIDTVFLNSASKLLSDANSRILIAKNYMATENPCPVLIDAYLAQKSKYSNLQMLVVTFYDWDRDPNGLEIYIRDPKSRKTGQAYYGINFNIPVHGYKQSHSLFSSKKQMQEFTLPETGFYGPSFSVEFISDVNELDRITDVGTHPLKLVDPNTTETFLVVHDKAGHKSNPVKIHYRHIGEITIPDA